MSLAIRGALLALPCAALLIAPVSAQDEAPAHAEDAARVAAVAPLRAGFEHVLPADCVAFLGVADMAALRRDAEASAWGRLMQDPACSELREGLSRQWTLLRDGVKAELGVDALQLVELMHGPAAVALTSLPDPATESDVEGAGVGLALLVDFGEEQDSAALIIEQLLDRATDAGSARSTESFGDIEIALLHDGDLEAAEEHVLRVAFHGSTLVVVLGAWEPDTDVMVSLLEGLDGEGEDSLAERAAFRGSVAAQAGGLQAWVDVATFIRFTLAQSLAEARLWADEGDELEDAPSPIDGLSMTGFFDKLGLLGMQSLAMHGTWDARGTRSRMQLAMSGDGWVPRALRTMLSPTAKGHPGSVPADSQTMLAWNWDLPNFMDLALKIALESGALAPDELAATLASMEEDLGFDLREDLLELLDGQITTVLDEVDPSEALPGTEDAPMGFALIVGVRDGKAFNALLEDVIRSRGLHAARQRLEFQGHEIYSVPLPPIAMQYCVLPDALVLSMSGTMLQDVLRHRGNAELPCLAASEHYQAALAAVSPRPGFVMYADAGKGAADGLAAMAEGTSTLLAMSGGSEELGLLMPLLEFLANVPMPERAVVEKYIRGGSISTATVDESGLWIESAAP